MLPSLVFLALAIFAAALFWSPHAGRAAYLHLMLAAGAMPLIFGAMSHFIPVLTRTREAERVIGLVPVVALTGGALAVAAFSPGGFGWGWQAGAVLAMTSTLALFVWSRKRRAAMRKIQSSLNGGTGVCTSLTGSDSSPLLSFS